MEKQLTKKGGATLKVNIVLVLFFLNITLYGKNITNLTEPSFEITYTFSQPDPWGENFWVMPNQNDTSWLKAKDTQEISASISNKKADEVFIRLKIRHSASTLNNLYFKIRHSGPFEVFINGNKSLVSTQNSDTKKDYLVNPRRPEQIGENIYAIHFKNTLKNRSYFDLEIRKSAWISKDEGSYRTAAILPDMMRDAEICKSGDGAYYLTGTTGDNTFLLPNPKYWLTNPGIQVFRSTDLKKWNSLGYVWTFEKDGTWNKTVGEFGGRQPARGIFAPEIKYHGNKYWINYSVNNRTEKRFFGIGLLYSDRPEGPYKEVSPQMPLTEGFDSNVFFDDDGSVYMLKQGGEIAKLKPDFRGFEEPFRHLKATDYPHVGYEGVNLFKYQGRYYLSAADWNVHEDGKISYDSMIASSDNIYGPYSKRYCAIRYGGHNSYFIGPDEQIYATVWCYPDNDPHWQKVSILKMKLDKEGCFNIVRNESK
nr:family 43 glycosylhydrolase [uncultured Pedobacter sp.]